MTNNKPDELLSCREAFEAWYLQRNSYLLGNIPIDDKKNYILGRAKEQWEIWQAAWKARPTSTDSGETNAVTWYNIKSVPKNKIILIYFPNGFNSEETVIADEFEDWMESASKWAYLPEPQDVLVHNNKYQGGGGRTTTCGIGISRNFKDKLTSNNNETTCQDCIARVKFYEEM